jgi:preprotein translocase subunit SecA
MLKWLGNLIDSNEREVKRLQPLVDDINLLEPDFEKLSDAELRAKTDEFKARLAEALNDTQQQLTEARERQEATLPLEQELAEVRRRVLNEILPEAFAAVREAAKRTIKQRHFDVQLIGGIVLHQGKIAEMKTGEGKTLVATLPLYLNALAGQGCHLVTVNDYLARRDCYWMGPIYHALGISVAAITAMQNQDNPFPSYTYDPDSDSGDEKWKHLHAIPYPPNRPQEGRRQAYQADITYGTNNEFGFDYLRDNMVGDLSECVQRSLSYAIVDEVDNILIDEARTPLIISGAAEEATKKYYTFARLAAEVKKDEDYSIDERTRTVSLTDEGMNEMERQLKGEGLLEAPELYDPSNFSVTHHLENALKAQALFKKDKDYIVKNGQVIIVDEFTGRLMFGRRYSEGLHQAIEAKEGVNIQRESVTMATITFQNYFRMYEKLAGMTGTAVTEAEEFHKIYKLEVVVLPTNVEYRAKQGELQTINRRENGAEVTTYENQKTGELYWKRSDYPDQIYKDEKTKFAAVTREIKELNDQGRPVLSGTTSIEKSELLADLLKRNGISYEVLNAKNHEKEAAIIAQAGRLGAVTVATNMAGRGVDIILGGNPEERDEAEWQEEHNKVVELGGLHIVGTEHHEARRIDNQLRGRAGRQGDPGSSRFYASLEDEIVSRFGGDRVKGIMQWAGMDENTPIEHSFATRAMTNSQVKTEGYHFDIRKHLVEYDDVVNKHREVIYADRKKILSGGDLKANILSMVKDEVHGLFDEENVRLLIEHEIKGRVYDHFARNPNNGNLQALVKNMSACFPIPDGLGVDMLSALSAEEIIQRLVEHARGLLKQWDPEADDESRRLVEHLVMPALIQNRLTDQISDDRGRKRVILGIFPELPAQFKPATLSRQPFGQTVNELIHHAEDLYERLGREVGVDDMRRREREILLWAIDRSWMNHLTDMDELRQGIGLRAAGQEQPLVVYKREAHRSFENLLANIRHDVAHSIYHAGISREAPKKKEPVPVTRRAGQKVGRNDPCPCGSGKKYKHCCGK